MKRHDELGSITSDDLQRIDRLLSSFLADTGARCVVLIERSGQLLATAGDTGGFDGVAFASLAAADFAASDQLAVLLGEEEFSFLYHQGDQQSMFLADLCGTALLATLFDGRTTLGLVRLRTRAVTGEFAALFEDLGARPMGSEAALGMGWADAAAHEIDRLFGE